MVVLFLGLNLGQLDFNLKFYRLVVTMHRLLLQWSFIFLKQISLTLHWLGAELPSKITQLISTLTQVLDKATYSAST